MPLERKSISRKWKRYTLAACVCIPIQRIPSDASNMGGSVHKNKGVVERYADSILFLIRESAGCGFNFPVHTVTTPLEFSQIPVHIVRALERQRA